MKHFDFDENAIFKKAQTFCARLHKLNELFSTLHQFNSLGEYNLEGMSILVQNFNAMLVNFRRRTYDFLDTSLMQFEKDYADFTKYVLSLLFE